MIAHDYIEKFASLESELSAKKGDFALFALFMRGELPDRWDLIVSAPWLPENRQAAVNYLVNEIKSQLGVDALITLSQIAVFDSQHVSVQDFNRTIQVEHGDLEIRDRYLFGLPIRLAHIITSKRPAAPVVK